MSWFQGVLEANRRVLMTPGGFPIHYVLPLSVMMLVLIYWIVARKKIAAFLGDKGSGFVHGFLLAAACVMALLAAGNYTNLGQWRYNSYLNAWEFYHYYLGSKYAPELGYTKLYGATLVADDETGLKYRNAKKGIRNLETGRYIKPPQRLLEDRAKFKAPFSEARWKAFVADVRWFKKKLVSSRWNAILCDKGYNATPVWSFLVGGLFSNRVSTANETGMLLLALLDAFLIAAAFACVMWAFGPRTAFLMIVLLGTHYMMKFSHMKGSYLRTDFVMSLVMAVCMVKKEHYRIAGVLAAYSFLCRVFPAVFVFGLGAKLLWELLRAAREAGRFLRERWGRRWDVAVLLLLPHLVFVAALGLGLAGLWAGWLGLTPVRIVLGVAVVLEAIALAASGVWGLWTRRLDTRYVQFFVAFAVTVVLLVGGSLVYFGNLDLWKDFTRKIAKHNQDISPWRVGFKYLFIAKFPNKFDYRASLAALAAHTKDLVFAPAPAKDAAARRSKTHSYRALLREWAPVTRSRIYREHPELWWTIQAAMLAVCLFAVKGLRDEEAFAFSFVPVFFLVAPTYYYYIMLLVPFLFFAPQLERPTRGLGVIWMFATAMAGHYAYSMWSQKFPTYFWMSAMTLVLVLYMVLLALGKTMLSLWRREPEAQADGLPATEAGSGEEARSAEACA